MGTVRGPKKFGDAGAPPLWMGAWLTLETDPSPVSTCYCAEFGHSWSSCIGITVLVL